MMMRKFLETTIPITLVATMLASTFALAFASGGHIMNENIHEESNFKASRIDAAVVKHNQQPHPDAISRAEYAADIKDIRDSMRDIRQAIRQLVK